jgi:glycosyltransferase involved in cell wall biosynthesis
MVDKKIVIIIPAFNEEASVGEVIERVHRQFPGGDVVVINDGSTDLTAEKARANQATVLDLPFNLGIGGAMQTGYRYAYEKGYDIAIQVDADGQHDPAEIPKLLEALEVGGADMVVGSRFVGESRYKASIMRRLGISVLSGVISIINRQIITDPTSGFRAANRRAMELFAADYPQDYPEPEVLVLMGRCGLRIEEVAVKIDPRFYGESSITRIRSAYYMIKVLLAIFVDIFKKTPILREEGSSCSSRSRS